MSDQAVRIEHDLLGDKAVPANAYYGVQTARALENCSISGVQLRLCPDVIRGFAMVKLAAARANVDCGVFDREVLRGIDLPMQDVVQDDALRARIEALRVALKSARDTAGEMIAQGAGVSFGFNAMDGD